MKNVCPEHGLPGVLSIDQSNEAGLRCPQCNRLISAEAVG